MAISSKGKISFSFAKQKALIQKLNRLSKQELLQVASSTMYQEGEKIMAISKEKYVPVATGNLKSSGQVSLPKTSGGTRVEVEMGYGNSSTEYAIYVHENPRAGKTKGKSPSGAKYKRYSKVGKWKYLEIPFRKRRPKARKVLILNIRRKIKQLSSK